MSVRGGLPFFWSLIKALEHFRSNEPAHDILGLLDRYDHPWEEDKKKEKNNNNKHASVIFLLAKRHKIPHFCR
jgi:hypothetical protein